MRRVRGFIRRRTGLRRTGYRAVWQTGRAHAAKLEQRRTGPNRPST